jgi:carbamoyltransferase
LYTLGINAAYHDSAACLVKDGLVIAAAEEERFTRKKHGKRPSPFSTYELPFYSIDYCLRAAGINLKDVRQVAYSFDPSQLLGKYSRDATITLPLEPAQHPTPEEWVSAWDPLFISSIVNAPRQLVRGFPFDIAARFRGCRLRGDFKWHFVQHHIAHAASAFYPSPFREAAILTIDGRGERACATYNFGSNNQIQILAQIDFPHSIGLLYENVTEHLGFLHSSDEYKIMAMASYGRPVYSEYFEQLITWTEQGRYQLKPYDLESSFGPSRKKGEAITQFHFDLARSIQFALEETVLKMTSWLHKTVQTPYLCIAGGVALNCVMNSRLRNHGPFKNIWVQPAAGDAGTALGAALWIDAQQRNERSAYCMDHVSLGPEYSEYEIEAFLRNSKMHYRRTLSLTEETAELLYQNKILGWFQGRSEFGPRALGCRSILASPISDDMQYRLNEIKGREDFRPVAPAVIEEEASNWFVNADCSPFMLFVFDVRPEKSSLIPAIRHADGTARIQTVNRSQNSLYYDLLKAFERRTGIPVLINTSFNTNGEPIVCSPRDAVACFWSSPLDALVIGPFILEK